MGSMLVVVCPPDFRLLTHFFQGSEHIGIQQFPPDASVASLHVSVLHRLSGLDEDQGDPMILAPGIQGC